MTSGKAVGDDLDFPPAGIPSIQTGTGIHLASYEMNTGIFLGANDGRAQD